jgi:hypothetical protein
MLLKLGADRSLTGRKGRTPLDLAEQRRHPEVASLLHEDTPDLDMHLSEPEAPSSPEPQSDEAKRASFWKMSMMSSSGSQSPIPALPPPSPKSKKLLAPVSPPLQSALPTEMSIT